jgi:glycosyltransferase involved in cell wall biosynthesis
MRILMVNHEFTITGASMVFLRLATHLRGQGHGVAILPCNPAHGPVKRRYDELGIPVLEDAVVTEFDLVIANTICAAQVVLQAGRFVPTIWFLHEAEIGLNILLGSPALAAAFTLAAAVVYQTAHQREVYRSFTYQLEPGKFHIIPNGIDPVPSLPPVAAKTRALRIVQVGSVERRKRPGDLIRAVADSGLDAECVICGRIFELDDEARAIAAQAPGRYRLTGEIEPREALAWMASADICTLVSQSETQGLSAYEAAALSRPLVLSDLPCHRGVFAHGQNCLMFPAGHVEMLALTLRMYAASPRLRQEMGEGARLTAQRFTSAAFYARFEMLIASLA